MIPKINFFCCHCPLMSTCENLLGLVVSSTHDFEKLGLGSGSKSIGLVPPLD